jgi:methyl-accepting chemotaxis protein
MDITIFVAITSAAVVIQAGILVAMFLALRKTSSKVEGLAEDFRTKILPTAEIVHDMLSDFRPKLETTMSNVADTSTLLRAQIERLDATISDVMDRTRLQIIRADDLVTKTMDRVEDATDTVHRHVVSPIRKISGIIQGLTVGLDFLMGPKHRKSSRAPVPQDEMFI